MHALLVCVVAFVSVFTLIGFLVSLGAPVPLAAFLVMMMLFMTVSCIGQM